MTLSIDMQCDYSQSGLIQWEMMYTCRAKNIEIRVANQTIENVNDQSVNFKQNNLTKTKNDVKGLYFIKLTINFLPLKVFETFPNMKYFGIVDSSLHNLNHGDFSGYNKLTVLDITDNNIRTLNDNIFDGTTKLLKLGLNSNQIRNISKSAFKGLFKLEVLNLSKNKIQSLLNETFEDLRSLKVLNLQRNYINELKFGLLLCNQHLEDIDFGLNALQYVNSTMFQHLSTIKYIEFGDNYCINEYFTNTSLKDIETKLEKQCSESSETINTTSDEIKFLQADLNYVENNLLELHESSSIMSQMATNQTLKIMQLTLQFRQELQNLKESLTKLQKEMHEKSSSDFGMHMFWIIIVLTILCIILGGFIYFRIVKRSTNTIQHMRMRDF